MYLPKEKVEDSIIYKEEIESCAMLLLKEINDISPINGYKFLSFSDIDLGSVEFSGEYFCSCCTDYESYEYSFDSVLLYDKTSRELFINNLKKEAAKK